MYGSKKCFVLVKAEMAYLFQMYVLALCWRWLCVEMRSKDHLTVSCMLTWVCWLICPLDQLKSPHIACGQTCRTMPSARVGHKNRTYIEEYGKTIKSINISLMISFALTCAKLIMVSISVVLGSPTHSEISLVQNLTTHNLSLCAWLDKASLFT